MLAEMRDWLIHLRVATADGSGLARAIDYSLNRWASLNRYAQTGNLPWRDFPSVSNQTDCINSLTSTGVSAVLEPIAGTGNDLTMMIEI